MLVSHRTTRVPSVGATIATHALVHSAYRLHVVRNEGVISEDRLSLRAFERKGHLDRPMATTILAGRARIEADGSEHWLEAGDMIFLSSKDGVRMRQAGERFESVALEWAPGSIGGSVPTLGIVKLDVRDCARLRAAADVVASKGRGHADAAREVVDVARAAGAPLASFDPGDLDEDVPEGVLRVGRALDETLSNLAGRPMVIDLDQILGLSSRHVQRVVRSFNERFGFNALGWRDTLNRRRTLIGAAMMTAPGATTDAIARSMGYGSPAAFCRAMAGAGLPSPGNIAHHVKALL